MEITIVDPLGMITFSKLPTLFQKGLHAIVEKVVVSSSRIGKFL